MRPPTASSALSRLGARPNNHAVPAKLLRQCASVHTHGTVTTLSSQPLASPMVARPTSRFYFLRNPILLPVRRFHSHDHPPLPGPFGATEATLLAAAYKHVPEHGFTTTALAFGARDAGFPDVSTSVLPDGDFGLIRWHLVKQREALAARAEELFGSQKGSQGAGGESTSNSKIFTIPEKLEMLMWERLVGNQVVIGQWQQALAVMAHPTHVPTSVKMLADLADEIVYLSGDKAVDPSWYSTRAGISAIYASTELFMTSDKSEGFADTRRFLRRRMEEAKGMKKAVGSIGQWVGFNAMGALNVARSWGMKI